MALAEDLAAQREGLGVERLGLAIPALARVEHRHPVEAGERIGMALTKGLSAQRERLGIERLGLAVPALALVQSRHVVEAGDRAGMGLTEDLAAQRQRLLEEWLGLAVAALSLVEERQVVEAGERVGMGLAELRPGQRQRLFGKVHATFIVARLVGGDHAIVELIPSFGRRTGLARRRSRCCEDKQADDGKAFDEFDHGDAPECCEKSDPAKNCMLT